MKLRILIMLAWSAILFSNVAQAHKPSDSYLRLKIAENHIAGQWAIALRDLDYAIGLDSNDNGEITWGELREHYANISAYALARLQLASQDSPCQIAPIQSHQQRVERLSDGSYASFDFTADCSATIQELSIDYSLFFDLDPQHRGLVQLQQGLVEHSIVLSPSQSSRHIQLQHSNWMQQFADYFASGVWHIAIGFDHILFVVTLLLPAVLYRQAGRWQQVSNFRAAAIDSLKVVTAFTIAHSITLSLASLDIVRLPGSLVEATIAASVVIAALNNLIPLFPARRWSFAFAFGLIHGFGFAAVLSDVGLSDGSLAISLLAFNLGVEAGQLAIVASLLPILYLLRRQRLYRPLIHVSGSMCAVAIGMLWLYERLSGAAILSS